MKFKKAICAALGFVFALGMCGCGDTTATPNNPNQGNTGTLKSDMRELTPQEYSIANLTAIDDYGRTVTVSDPTTDDRYVGLFYFAWLGNQNMSGIYDVNKLEQTNPTALYNPLDNEDSKPWQFHFTSEPLYGYYSMNDPWVITRHVELFTMAGIDYILFDYTNAVEYNNVATLVLQTLKKFKAQGWKVPGVGFYTNSYSQKIVKHLYKEFYESGRYDDLWFRFKGDDRPVIVGVSSANIGSTDQPLDDDTVLSTSSNEYKYFNFYESQWPSGSKVDENKGLPWMQWGTPLPHNNGCISVSVAQHGNGSVFYSDCLPTSSRGYNGAGGVNEDWQKGDNFQWQWDEAFKYADSGMVKNIFVTGFNEWTAIKMPAAKYHSGDNSWSGIPYGASAFTGKEIYMVDDYNAEYSRDIDLSTVHGDKFYMQFVQNVRRFKRKAASKYKMRTRTIADITDFSAWRNVFVEYADFTGDAMARDGENAANVKHSYVDNSDRNDIKTIKVIHDSENVYVYVQTVEDITEYNGTDTNWMNLFISSGDTAKSFAGFNYVINRRPKADGKTSVEVSRGGYDWLEAGVADYYVSGNEMVYKIPLGAIGLTSGNVEFSFKVADNVTKQDDILDYYVSGDSAPIGRFGYAYGK